MKKAISIIGLLVIVGAAAGIVWVWLTGSAAPMPMLDVNADQLKRTVVTPHLDEPMTAGKNVLWCSTFQLAWNEACDLVGEDIHMAGETPMVASLDKHEATKADIDPASFIAMAGWSDNGIVDAIQKAFAAKFPTERLPDFGDLSVDGSLLIAYAYLAKDLKFVEPFEPIDSMQFKGSRVQGFGITKHTGRADAIADQVVILDVKETPDHHAEFIVELKTTSGDDRLILAKVKPLETLSETIKEVEKRIAKGPGEAHVSKIPLYVPKLNFKVLKDYEELLGKKFTLSRAALNDRVFILAEQMIRFKLDEHGAVLKSESRMAADKAAVEYRLIFDEPFLILMQRKGAAKPYFALWVDNEELLLPAR